MFYELYETFIIPAGHRSLSLCRVLMQSESFISSDWCISRLLSFGWVDVKFHVEFYSSVRYSLFTFVPHSNARMCVWAYVS